MEQTFRILEPPEQQLSWPERPPLDSAEIPVAILRAVLMGQRNEEAETFPLAFTGEGFDRHLLPENCLYGLEYLQGQLKKFDRWNNRNSSTEKTIITLETPAIWMAGPGSENFFHWIHDLLPRLLVAQAMTESVTIFIPPESNKNKFIKQSL